MGSLSDVGLSLKQASARPHLGEFRSRAEYILAYNKWYRKTPNGGRKHREFERQRVAAKLSAVSMLKLEKGCADCGYNKHPEALDFDHTKDNKVMGVARMVSKHMSLEAILEEAEKCEVVCANCHRVRTADRRASTWVDR